MVQPQIILFAETIVCLNFFSLFSGPLYPPNHQLLERGIAPSARLSSQSGYCEYMADGTKALVMKKVFSEAEKEEMISLNSMKKKNAFNAERRRQKFGQTDFASSSFT